MSVFVWIVKALPAGEDEWVRLFKHFRQEEEAWLAILVLAPLFEVAGDYDQLQVVRTVAFRSRR